MDWSAVGVLHVFSGDLVPNSTYSIQVITSGCDELNPLSYSAPLIVQTGEWGDVGPPFAAPGLPPQPDFTDIYSVVEKFLALPPAPIKASAQLQPNTPIPTLPVSFNDIAAAVDAFSGMPYPAMSFANGPCPCPSTVACNGTACTADADCPGGTCVGGFCDCPHCADECGRCH